MADDMDEHVPVTEGGSAEQEEVTEAEMDTPGAEMGASGDGEETAGPRAQTISRLGDLRLYAGVFTEFQQLLVAHLHSLSGSAHALSHVS